MKIVIAGIFAVVGLVLSLKNLIGSPESDKDGKTRSFELICGIIGFVLSSFVLASILTYDRKTSYDGGIVEISCYNSGVTYNRWTVSRVASSSDDDKETCYYYEYNNSGKGKVKISTEKGDEIFSCFEKMDKNNAPKESSDSLSNSGVSYLCEGETSSRKAELLDKDLEKIFSMITGLESERND